ncbi:MAG: hypothetical protein M1831_001832 [Alyxoria varia]|nr:MAG: hypothetical protein M1831_001832 [Alyxoria varia]
MSIGPDDYYDGVTGCHRSTEAYSAQLLADKSWHAGNQNGVFNGCSGFILGSLLNSNTSEGEKPWYQLENNPSVVFMQAGGCDSFLPNLLRSCIYHEVPGVSEASPNDCAAAINRSTNYLKGTDVERSLTAAHDRIFNSSQARYLVDQGQTLHLYSIGYANLFNDETSWCDSISFAPHDKHPLLKRQRRRSVNDVTSLRNEKLRSAVENYKPPYPNQRIGFIDINNDFESHRFCEDDHRSGGVQGQHLNDDIWFYNFDPSQEHCASPNEQASSGHVGPSDTVPSDGNSDPSRQGCGRAFHPTFEGHHAIKNAIIRRLRADAVPGIVGVNNTAGCVARNESTQKLSPRSPQLAPPAELPTGTPAELSPLSAEPPPSVGLMRPFAAPARESAVSIGLQAPVSPPPPTESPSSSTSLIDDVLPLEQWLPPLKPTPPPSSSSTNSPPPRSPPPSNSTPTTTSSTNGPLSVPTTFASCTDEPDLFYDSYEMGGYGFRATDIGPDGESLKRKLLECTLMKNWGVSEWEFEVQPPGFYQDWKVSFRLPWAKNECVEDKMREIGAERFSCSVVGARRAGGPGGHG